MLSIHVFQVGRKYLSLHRLKLHSLPLGDNNVQKTQRHIFKPLSLCVNIVGREKVFLLIQFPRPQQTRIADNRGQGGLQLMGKGGNEILPGSHFLLQLPDGSLQHIGHTVKIHGQLSQLIAADLTCTITVVTCRHLPGGLSQKPDGLGEPGTDQKHDHGADQQHGQRHPPVHGESLRALLKNFRHILQSLQIQIPIQGIDHNTGVYVVMFPQGYHLPGSGVLQDLLKKRGVLRKAHAGIEHLFLFIGQPQETPRTLAAALQLGSDLLHRGILKHIVLGRNVQCRRLKGKLKNTAVVQGLAHLPFQGRPKHGVHKKVAAEPKGHRHDNHGPQQNFV